MLSENSPSDADSSVQPAYQYWSIKIMPSGNCWLIRDCLVHPEGRPSPLFIKMYLICFLTFWDLRIMFLSSVLAILSRHWGEWVTCLYQPILLYHTHTFPSSSLLLCEECIASSRFCSVCCCPVRSTVNPLSSVMSANVLQEYKMVMSLVLLTSPGPSPSPCSALRP